MSPSPSEAPRCEDVLPMEEYAALSVHENEAGVPCCLTCELLWAVAVTWGQRGN